MLEQAYLREQLQALLDQEHQAAAAYGKLAIDLSDPKLKSHVEHVLRDKHKHIQLAERLLEILQ